MRFFDREAGPKRVSEAVFLDWLCNSADEALRVGMLDTVRIARQPQNAMLVELGGAEHLYVINTCVHCVMERSLARLTPFMMSEERRAELVKKYRARLLGGADFEIRFVRSSEADVFKAYPGWDYVLTDRAVLPGMLWVCLTHARRA